MTEAIKVLLHAEAVLVKKIKVMMDGKPKYAANERLHEVRDALAYLKAYNEFSEKMADGTQPTIGSYASDTSN